MATFNVRLRHPTGMAVLSLSPDTTCDELKSMIFSSSNISVDEQDLKFGYPPKAFPASFAGEVEVSSIPLTKGEQIIVASLPPGSSSTPTIGGEAPVVTEATIPAKPSMPLPQAIPVTSSPTPPPRTASINNKTNPPRQATPVTTSFSSSKETTIDLGRGAGIMQHRIVPDDNSCLFSSIGIIFKGGYDDSISKGLRKVIADEIAQDEFNYPEVVLGRSRSEYIQTIQKPSTWGGAIELAIFSKHFATEIDSFDVLSGRVDKFGEGQYDTRCLLVYSGIHYDAITTAPMANAPADFHTTLFPLSDNTILPAAQRLVEELKKQHYYTDTANFDLRCQICRVGLKGEAGAREHAKQTGHVDFGEY